MLIVHFWNATTLSLFEQMRNVSELEINSWRWIRLVSAEKKKKTVAELFLALNLLPTIRAVHKRKPVRRLLRPDINISSTFTGLRNTMLAPLRTVYLCYVIELFIVPYVLCMYILQQCVTQTVPIAIKIIIIKSIYWSWIFVLSMSIRIFNVYV